MGMAASQARLLTLTARLHDIEYQAQSIQNAKIQLATQSDQVYQDYLATLDAQTLTIKNTTGELIPANFDNICGPNAVEAALGKHFMFRDSKNNLIVPDDVAQMYDDYISGGFDRGNAYAFALFALGGNQTIGDGTSGGFIESIEKAEQQAAESDENDKFAKLQENMQKILTDVKEHTGKDIEYIGDFDNVAITCPEHADYLAKAKEQYLALQSQYQRDLYNKYAENINEYAGGDTTDFDENQFNYYVRMFKAIEANYGGCTPISDFNGIDGIGNASTDGEWLMNMIKCGKITIDEYSEDKKTGAAVFTSTGVPSDSVLEYTTTTNIDKKALAKAEAEYEHKTKQIDQKEKRFDMDLSKLETEREAVKTEYDSVKKVISDNIERTFGIFS